LTSNFKTAEYFEISYSAVSKIINKWHNIGDFHDYFRSGRPSLNIEMIEVAIIERVKQNKYVTS